MKENNRERRIQRGSQAKSLIAPLLPCQSAGNLR
jgi:hypothetical protein